MTRWMPAQSTAFVEPGESSPQACSTGVGASTTTMDGVDLVAWKMTTVIARKTLVALLLEFNSSWSWWLCFGRVPCPPLVSSCWRSPVCFASATMSKRWALILITTLHPRLTLWEKSLSHHPKPTPLWPQNLRQQPEHESCMSIGQLRGSESTGSCWQLLAAAGSCLVETCWRWEVELLIEKSASSVWNHAVKSTVLIYPVATGMNSSQTGNLVSWLLSWSLRASRRGKFCGRVASMRPLILILFSICATRASSSGSCGTRSVPDHLTVQPWHPKKNKKNSHAGPICATPFAIPVSKHVKTIANFLMISPQILGLTIALLCAPPKCRTCHCTIQVGCGMLEPLISVNPVALLAASLALAPSKVAHSLFADKPCACWFAWLLVQPLLGSCSRMCFSKCKNCKQRLRGSDSWLSSWRRTVDFKKRKLKALQTRSPNCRTDYIFF